MLVVRRGGVGGTGLASQKICTALAGGSATGGRHGGAGGGGGGGICFSIPIMPAQRDAAAAPRPPDGMPPVPSQPPVHFAFNFL